MRRAAIAMAVAAMGAAVAMSSCRESGKGPERGAAPSAEKEPGAEAPGPVGAEAAPGTAEKEGPGTARKESNPVVEMKTSEGTIRIELWADKAPTTVENFLRYAEEKFYDGTIFHRVIANFMIQGGGFTADMRQKPTRDPIRNEASAAAGNERGTIAMARTNVVDSATAQFFINVVDNEFLNHQDKTPQGFGYCVFGKVVAGMDVVDRIRQVATRTVGPFENVPARPVVIESVRVEVEE